MTIFGPDISNYQAGLVIQPATVFVIAKATEGTSFKDSTYDNFKSQTVAEGGAFVAYHFLHQGNAVAQAQFAYSVVGPGVPMMIDCEPEPSIGSNPTVQDCIDFRDEFNRLGGDCSLVYFPRWYWNNLGQPSLTALNPMGLVASGYTAYSDNNPDWNPYGGLSPVIWQFTDSFQYGGKSVDFDAFRGTIDQFRVLVGASHVTPVPPPPPPVPVPPVNTNTPQWRAHHNTYTPVPVDGAMGPMNWKAIQFVIGGLAVDGIPGWNTRGAFQRYLGAFEDHIIGPQTVKDLQRHLGMTGADVDGNWGPHTTTVLEEHLNAGTF